VLDVGIDFGTLIDKERSGLSRERLAIEKIVEDLIEIKDLKPLIHNITNYVVMNDTANVLIHLGASPAMVHAREEVEEFVRLSNALVLNIGTATPAWIESMLLAGKAANAQGVPVVFDPVGVGATRFRSESSLRILEEVKVAVVRGNAAEVSILGGIEAQVKGVDAGFISQTPAFIAKQTANRLGTTVAVTGPQDAISNGEQVLLVNNGHEMLCGLTGTGCMVTAMTGAFLAIQADPMQAALGALVCFGIAGQRAAKLTSAPGSFRVALMDEIYRLKGDIIRQEARIQVCSAE
jgi:hydroxyethylthiazole kinase